MERGFRGEQMKTRIMTWIKSSFHRELLVSFAAVALLPFLIFGIFLIQVTENRINGDNERRVTAQAEQIDAGFLEEFDRFREIVSKINADATILEYMEKPGAWARSRTYLRFYRAVSDDRDYAEFALYNPEGACVFTTGRSAESRALPTYWGILRAAEQADSSALIFRKAEENSDGVLLYAAGRLTGADGGTRGYVVISMTADHFEALLTKSGNKKAEAAFLDSYWRLIYGTGFLEEDELRDALMEGHHFSETYRTGEVLIEPLGDSGLYTVMDCPTVFSGEVLVIMYRVLFAMLAATMALCLFMAGWLTRGMTRPIERMNTAMRTLQEGDLTVRVASDREDELGQMSRNFNIMANELAENAEEKVRRQKELNESHIAMMQAQLNPHFLYNTLDTMKWVAKANHIPEIATMAAGLARILRTSISERQFVRLREELDLVGSYMEIQRIRFGDKFHYEVEAPEELTDCVIPKLILQPIVENAVLHGLKESERGEIRVRIRRETGFPGACERGDFSEACPQDQECGDVPAGDSGSGAPADILLIEVTDDGCGIPDDILKALNERKREPMKGHIGVLNVDTILRLTYGEEYGVRFLQAAGQGTRVILRLPARKSEPQEKGEKERVSSNRD